MLVAEGAQQALQVLGRDEPVLVGVKEPPRLVQMRILLVREAHERHVPWPQRRLSAAPAPVCRGVDRAGRRPATPGREARAEVEGEDSCDMLPGFWPFESRRLVYTPPEEQGTKEGASGTGGAAPMPVTRGSAPHAGPRAAGSARANGAKSTPGRAKAAPGSEPKAPLADISQRNKENKVPSPITPAKIRDSRGSTSRPSFYSSRSSDGVRPPRGPFISFCSARLGFTAPATSACGLLVRSAVRCAAPRRVPPCPVQGVWHERRCAQMPLPSCRGGMHCVPASLLCAVLWRAAGGVQSGASPLTSSAPAAMAQKENVGSRASDASSRLSSASTVRGSDAGFTIGGSLLSSAR